MNTIKVNSTVFLVSSAVHKTV